jgi:hypothetical protein
MSSHTFQKAMNSALAPLPRKSVLLFFNDILVYSQSYEQHLHHLEQVLQLLQQHQWRVRLSKCSFAQREISYLGYLISDEGGGYLPVQTRFKWLLIGLLQLMLKSSEASWVWQTIIECL